jgi:spermidine synthase
VTNVQKRGAPLGVFFVLFTISGFAGLIYQSIWSHYIKLFLGHAAYAQTIVLAIFMGGMALGAWLCARYSQRIRNPLMGYAIAEVIIGLCALVFHSVFIKAIAFAYDTAIPGIGAPLGVDLFKWSLAAALMLPQSILLGTTFPLMTGGVLRRFPDAPGTSLSMLYFTNSFGAAVGVLVCGFVLIAKFGLPGSLLTAGIINIALGLVVWLLARGNAQVGIETAEVAGSQAEQTAEPTTTPLQARFSTSASSSASKKVLRWMLLVAFLTGVVSFVYEVAWIRMLSLVLGSSTHAFELMLSALILGIALGAYWIRRRIDGYQNLIVVLGVVLAAKGIFAIATLPLYDYTFQAMQGVVNALSKSEGAYTGFNLFSHAISMAIMLPSAFFAGMSLPVITTYLLKQQHGEPVIGKVYAWNTVGAIVGVGIAVHVGLSVLGLRNLIIAAAVVDTLIAAVLLVRSNSAQRWLAPVIISTSAVAIVGSLVFVQFNALNMASGVFRDGKFYTEDSAKVVFSRDGKTATINVVSLNDGMLTISTNGKTDAALQTRPGAKPSNDEYTMVLAAALPLAYRPNATQIANIGFGSGLTTHAVLGSPTVKSVDSIEIEPAMIEGAKLFGKLVDRAYNDPRSNIVIDDAKSFFASRQRKYDIIISEPSNPWVSGVAGLFSREFYQEVKRYIRDDGLLVQWVQLYEIDEPLVASIVKALGEHFADYAMYEVSGSEVIIIASPNGRLGAISPKIFDMPNLASELKQLGLNNIDDLSYRRVATKSTLHAGLQTFPITPNSDYFPVVDVNAAKARFMGKRATMIGELGTRDAFLVDLLEGRAAPKLSRDEIAPAGSEASLRQAQAAVAYRIRDYLIDGPLPIGQANLPNWQYRAAYLLSRLRNCAGVTSDAAWMDSFHEAGRILSTHVAAEDAEKVWALLERACATELSGILGSSLRLYRAVSKRDLQAVTTASSDVLSQSAKAALPREAVSFALKAGMAARLSLNAPQQALQLFESHGTQLALGDNPDMGMRILVGNAVQQVRRSSTQTTK